MLEIARFEKQNNIKEFFRNGIILMSF